ncbi:agamous-like MADS-box protein AGL86 [Salvia divinorum]|uniref:Agamous-like MADS-box protein AGL86 n=1 Tax=Salvia divinorum TaxID=28513 RepID=A0ABD1IEB4_SALDI
MGRKKLKLQFIENRKLRLSTLKRRKGRLEKKLEELTTLCDANPSAVKAYGLSDFFKKNAKDELVKTEFPTWDHRLDLMDESQLRELSAAVRAEADAVRSRIDFWKREAMMKEEKNNNNVMLDVEEIVVQDEIFSIADDVMAATNAQLPMPPLYLPQPLKGEAMVKNSNNNVMLDLDEFEGVVDQDGKFSIADVMAVAMSAANAQLRGPDCLPQDYIFSVADVMDAINSNGQLEFPDYYCPQTFMDHNDLSHGYCSSMDAINSNGQLEFPDYYCTQTFMDHNDLSHGYSSSMDANHAISSNASYLWH